MPAGSPAASQLDTRRPEGELTAKRLRLAVAARSAFGGFAVVFVLALCSRPSLRLLLRQQSLSPACRKSGFGRSFAERQA